MTRLGIHQTGCVVGALRILQSWNFASILVEVRNSSAFEREQVNSADTGGSTEPILDLRNIV